MMIVTSSTALNNIIEKMTHVVEHSKNEIFHIGEEARDEYNQLRTELAETKHKVKEYIEKGDQLDAAVKKFRIRLSEVSRQFEKFTEDEIREVYEKTHQLQMKLLVMRQEESVFRKKRDDLERRLLRLERTVEQAENLGRKVAVVQTYLQDDINEVNELIKSAKEKHEFGLKIIEAQEEERKKLAREIHDGPAQMLANILLRSEIIDLAFRGGHIEDALEEVKSVQESIRSSLLEVRRIIYDLRPMALDDLGLGPTLKKYIETISDRSDVKVEFAILGKDKRLESKYEVAIFRLIQEALQNAVKHAQATVIKVILNINDDYVAMVIKDDGVGFDTENIGNQSFGLIGMKERVELLKGSFSLNSKINEGTTIAIKIPYNHH